MGRDIGSVHSGTDSTPLIYLLCNLGKLLHLWASILSKTVNNISWLVTRINELVHDTDKNRPRHMALTIAVYNPQQKITFTQCTPQSTLRIKHPHAGKDLWGLRKGVWC